MIKNGNLLTAQVDVIVQQSNCIGLYPKGIAKDIKDTLGVDPYVGRRRLDFNLAVEEDRDIPGTIKLLRTNTNYPKYVACLFSQYAMGKPKTYYGDETYEQRLKWFKKCLRALSKCLENYEIKTIGFPFGIGCGLAGGNWNEYLAVINDWTEKNKHLTVFIYKYN